MYFSRARLGPDYFKNYIITNLTKPLGPSPVGLIIWKIQLMRKIGKTVEGKALQHPKNDPY